MGGWGFRKAFYKEDLRELGFSRDAWGIARLPGRRSTCVPEVICGRQEAIGKTLWLNVKNL